MHYLVDGKSNLEWGEYEVAVFGQEETRATVTSDHVSGARTSVVFAPLRIELPHKVVWRSTVLLVSIKEYEADCSRLSSSACPLLSHPPYRPADLRMLSCSIILKENLMGDIFRLVLYLVTLENVVALRLTF